MVDDPSHDEATHTLEELNGVLKHTCHTVIEETATVLCYKYSKEQADKFVQWIMDNPDVVILEHDIASEADLFLSVDADLSFADASIISLSQQHDLHITSFDKQLLEVANSA